MKNYVHGKSPSEINRKGKFIKLASNESPFSPPFSIRWKFKKEINKIKYYPSITDENKLKDLIANNVEIKPENILLGNGSDELIEMILKYILKKNRKEIISAEHTFSIYSLVTENNGGKFNKIKMKDYEFDLDRIKKSISKKTAAVILCNPNNPTGTIIDKYELINFITFLPKDILLIIDEAYIDFIDIKDYPNTGEFAVTNKNIIILRTFSKVYGCAGLRLGYAIGNKNLIKMIEYLKIPFNVNTIALNICSELYKNKKFYCKVKNTIIKERQRIFNKLTEYNIKFIKSHTNFYMLLFECDADEIYEKFLDYGIITRSLKSFGINNGLRVSIGSKIQNSKFLKAINKICC